MSLARRKPPQSGQLLSHGSLICHQILLNLNPTQAARSCLSPADSKVLVASGALQQRLKTQPTKGEKQMNVSNVTDCQGGQGALQPRIPRGHHPRGSCHRLLVMEMLNHLW